VIGVPFTMIMMTINANECIHNVNTDISSECFHRVPTLYAEGAEGDGIWKGGVPVDTRLGILGERRNVSRLIAYTLWTQLFVRRRCVR